MNRLFARANKRISFGGAATLLFGVALAGQLLGFLRNRLISANFTRIDPGSSDAFFAAFQIPDFFFYTIAAGALGVAFMPFLTDRLEVGDRKSVWQLSSSLLNLMLIIMTVVGVIIFIFARPLMQLLAPNLPAENFEQAVTIMRLISFNPMLFTLSGILTSMQQVFGRFFFYAIAPLTYNLSIIASIYLFQDNIGIVGLGFGALAGAIIQLFIASLGLVGLGFRYSTQIGLRDERFRSMLRQLPPRALDQGVDQVNSIVEVNRAQALGVGPVSWYIYALTLMNVPITLLGNSIAIAAFPRLTERLAQNRRDLFRRDFARILQLMIWLTVPVVVVSYFSRAYLARLIFASVAPQVALIFGYLTIAIFFRVIYSMISRFFYANKDTKTPLYVSLFAIGLNIFLAFRLASPDAYGISGLAMAQSITATFEVLILTAFMIHRDNKILNSQFWLVMTKIASVTGFSILAAFTMISLLPLQIDDTGIIVLGGKLAAITGVTFVVHMAGSYLFGLDEARLALQKFKQIVFRPIRL
jgi:putative peptidoglycan lipid II flippase